MRKQLYQTVLENFYDLKLTKCRLQFNEKCYCHLLLFSAPFRSLYTHRIATPFFFFAGMPDDGVRHQNVFTKFPYTRLLNYPTDVTKVGLTGYNC